MAEDAEQLRAQIEELRERLAKIELESEVERRVREELAKRVVERPPEPERRSTMSAKRKSELLRADSDSYHRLPW
jgi:hypothetical protein